jgi:hypothetical protein
MRSVSEKYLLGAIALEQQDGCYDPIPEDEN